MPVIKYMLIFFEVYIVIAENSYIFFVSWSFSFYPAQNLCSLQNVHNVTATTISMDGVAEYLSSLGLPAISTREFWKIQRTAICSESKLKLKSKDLVLWVLENLKIFRKGKRSMSTMALRLFPSGQIRPCSLQLTLLRRQVPSPTWFANLWWSTTFVISLSQQWNLPNSSNALIRRLLVRIESNWLFLRRERYT